MASDPRRTPTRPPTLDHLPRQPRKVARHVTVGIYASDQIALDYEQADGALTALRAEVDSTRARRIAELAQVGVTGPEALVEVDAQDTERLADAEAARETALAALEADTLWFTFRGIGAKRMEALVREHPPTDQDREWAREHNQPEPTWSADFTEALIRESCVAPGDVDWDAVFEGDDWNATEIAHLAAGALAANTSVRTAQQRPPRLPGQAQGSP